MKNKCIEAVQRVAGRILTREEIKDIEDRISRNKRALAAIDRQKFLAMTPEQRLHAAAARAADEYAQEAIKKQQRLALTIQKHAAIENYLSEQKSKFGMPGMEALKRTLAFVADGKSRFQSVETRANAIVRDYVRQLVDTFEGISPKMMGLFTNGDGIRAMTYEMFGQDSSKIVSAETAAMAKRAAREWHGIADSAREAFNNAGGQIGRLYNWHMPQSHSQFRVAQAGQSAWVRDMFGKLDRRRYINDDGTGFSNAQLAKFLQEAWLEIATGGANSMEPGKRMTEAMLAKQNSHRRAIHFKDAESYLEYHGKYGDKDAYSTMMMHLNSLSHDIAMVDTLGPNPDSTFKYFLEKSSKEATLAAPTKLGKIKAQSVSLENLYDYMAGKSLPIASQRLAAGFDTLRSWLVATRLGSAFITSFTDNATMQLTASVNNMPHLQLLRNQLSTLNPANREELHMARRAGLSLHTLIGEVNRFGSEAMMANFASKAGTLTIRLSGLNAATEARRRAFGVTMFGSIGSTVEKSADFSSIDATDKRILESKGVNETDFKVWKEATQEDWGNGNDSMLTPEAIYRIPDAKLAALGDPKALRREAALKLMGMVNEEIDMAVIEPGARERAMLKMGTQRGTWKGEITRSFFLFKSFPLALIMKHWARGLNMETGVGRAAYLSSLIAGTTILGAAAQQVSNVVSGRDPQDMTSGKFWAQALMKGGSLGIYGDFILSTNTSYGQTPLAVLSGPVAGYIEDLIGLTQGNLVKYAQGKKTDVGADIIRLLKGNIPLQNLWYTKAATDRLIFNQLQEMLSPGHMRRIEQRARTEFGQRYFWKPGSVAPERAPDFGAMAGQ